MFLNYYKVHLIFLLSSVMVSSTKNEFETSILKPLPDITGKEVLFFTQIINQSTKTITKDFKNALKQAKKFLNNHSFILNSCKALKGFHTHNPKIYDAKVKGRIFASGRSFLLNSKYIYSDSIGYNHYYGWAGNAEHISKRYFLCAEFIHRDSHTTLYHEFLKESSELIDTLVSMGLTQEGLKMIKASCLRHNQKPFPDAVPPYQVQVLVPYDEGTDYLAVSPVASSSVQTAIHNFCWTKEALSVGRDFHHLQRPENIGALATATRGSICVLSPELKLQKATRLPASQIIKLLKSQEDLFVTADLDFSYFLKVRKKAQFSTNRYEPAPLSPEKSHILSLIEANIAKLFSRLNTLRSGYRSGRVEKKSIQNLRPAQQPYVTERKLSEAEMRSIWQEANASIQKFISSSSYRQLAYHPVLSRYISESIRNYLKPLYRGNIEAAKPELSFLENSSEAEKNAEQSSKTYLLIPNLSVFNAHADSSPYTSGLPAITAVMGFVDRLCRNIKSRFNIDLGPVSVAWLVHNFQRLPGIKKHEPARWNSKTKSAMADIVSRKFCNMTFDLVLENGANSSEELLELCSSLPECLPINFAAGVISTPEERPSDNWQSEAFQIFSSITELIHYLDGCCRWFVVDYSSRFKRNAESILSDLAGLYSHYKLYEPSDHFLSLSGVGYKLLETPRECTGSRLKLHAYCEPVVGVQELRLLHNSSVDSLGVLPIFWSYQKAGNLILCKAFAAQS